MLMVRFQSGSLAENPCMQKAGGGPEEMENVTYGKEIYI